MHVVMAGDYPADPDQILHGVEAVVTYLTQALQHYPDLKLDIVTLDRSGTVGRKTVRYGDLTVHYVPPARAPSYLSALGSIRRIRDAIGRLKPDLVHVQVANEYAEAAAGLQCPWVLTLHGIRFLEVDLWHGFMDKTYRGWFIKREERRAISRAKHLISISPFIQEVFNGQIRGQVFDIENPIASSFFEAPDRAEPGRLLFVGRLIPRKGVHILLRAFAKLRQRMPGVTLHLAGASISPNERLSYHQELERFVVEAGLTDAVSFLGHLEEPSLLAEYSACSALVLSSSLETAPMAVMQAMAAGKAVVSTDAGGARHLVEHGQTGLIVPPNDDEALAGALYQVLSDPDGLDAMGRRAKEAATRRFHAKAVAARTRDVYYQIFGQHPPR